MNEGTVPGVGSEVLVRLIDHNRTVRIPRSILVPHGAKLRSMMMWGKVIEEVLKGDARHCGSSGSTIELV